ncbi:YhjD/YihY/BrkB family envelope integrity protein [Sciscionella marina]|uniref:YhjD/YihY/BrkB family envelope integrity protein n=1 Tax=Sciscionella marina TaxID=508770 RepID=UPI0003999019|nr:YhjD/YihY/BrkB family envelope integrity protein [Sciscionella marina]
MARGTRVDTGAKPAEERPGFITRLRRRRPGIDHVLRAYDAYTERYGVHYAAALTYFSVLSLFPMVLLAFSVLGFVLAGDMALQNQIRDGIKGALPPGALRELIGDVMDTAIKQRGGTGIVGLVIALYSGVGWMGNLRNALTAQWGLKKPALPFLSTLVKDLLAMLGLGVALMVSFGLTALGSGFTRQILTFAGFDPHGPARYVLVVVSLLLSIAANWLIFLWVIARLPRARVSMRTAVRGALVMAVGFEILKQVMTIYLRSLQSNPAFTLFGPILGLMVFANFVSQLLLFLTAWTATAKENQHVEVPAPGAVVRPVLGVHTGPSGGQAAGLFGAGALLGILLWRRR